MHSIVKDGVTYSKPNELRDMWKINYEHPFNNSDYDDYSYDSYFKMYVESLVTKLAHQMDQWINTMQLFDVPFTAEEISILCASLPNNKAPGINSVMHEHLKFGGSALHKCIGIIFNEMIRRTKIANQLKIGLLFPAYKGKWKPKNNDNSYRGITLCQRWISFSKKAYGAEWKSGFINENSQIHSNMQAGQGNSSWCIIYPPRGNPLPYRRRRKGFFFFFRHRKTYDKIRWDGL